MDQSYLNQSIFQSHPYQPMVHPQLAAYYFQQQTGLAYLAVMQVLFF